MNLLIETMGILQENNKTLDDVKWIGGQEFSISKNQFIKLANTEYDNGYGGQEVAKDLVVVGTDFWLERHEYDGSEWWEYKELPKKMPEKEIHTLICQSSCWRSLAELQEDEK